MEKILLIYVKLNFTPNTLGCYGLIRSRVFFSLFSADAKPDAASISEAAYGKMTVRSIWSTD